MCKCISVEQLKVNPENVRSLITATQALRYAYINYIAIVCPTISSGSISDKKCLI